MPCSGNGTNTASCQSNCIKFFKKKNKIEHINAIITYLQLKEVGQYGSPGAHALQHVEQEQEPDLETLQVECHAQEIPMSQRAVRVSFGT